MSKRRPSIRKGQADSVWKRGTGYLLLLCLHVVYGFIFLLEHLVRRPWRAGLSGSHGTSSEIARDRLSWQKLPRHVAIAFPPSQRSSWRIQRRDKTAERVSQIADDITTLVSWCLQLGVKDVSVYDSEGLARESSAQIYDGVSKRLHVVSPPWSGSDEDAPPPSMLVASSSNASSPTCRVTLLGRQDGKEHIALVARRLAEGLGAGYLKASDVNTHLLQEKLQSSLIPEPDLLIVLGEPALRLRGFPPWHIRLTEIYHEPSLSLLGPARLSYQTFTRALGAYSASEQRRGR